jgi:hypothetical protein
MVGNLILEVEVPVFVLRYRIERCRGKIVARIDRMHALKQRSSVA